jgi:FKBP-type peptidyl-prolyl cis-trans isomerase
MSRNLKPGIRILDEKEGEGVPAKRGDIVEFESKGFLNQGQCIQEVYSSVTKLGSRRLIAGVEYALLGMKRGGYRKIRISPHLAYRDSGWADKIPTNAVLVYELWLRAIKPQSTFY